MQAHPALHAIQAQFINVDVTDPHGRKATFIPWFGALAHAIFFHEGSLDYFHTHICAPNAPNCGACPAWAPPESPGSSTAPGQAHGRRAAARARHLAAVPADEARRADRDRPLHAGGLLMKPLECACGCSPPSSRSARAPPRCSWRSCWSEARSDSPSTPSRTTRPSATPPAVRRVPPIPSGLEREDLLIDARCRSPSSA